MMVRVMKSAFVAAAILSASAAAAQGIPVHDALQYVQMINQVTNSGTQITKAVQQIEKLETTYESFSHITNAAGIASLLNNSAVRNLLPSEVTSMATLLSGNPSATGALGTLAKQFQRQYALPATAADGTSYESGVNDAYANYLNAVNGAAANMIALGSNTLAISNQRTSGLTDLQNQISSAKDPKDVMDLSVRATVENAQATNDLIKLQSIQMSQQAQSDLLLKQYWATRSRSANAVEYEAVSALIAR
jgi:type IV secretion system protein VirB5